MSNTSAINIGSAIREIQELLLVIKNEVLSLRSDVTKLKAQFNQPFAVHVSENEMSWIEEDVQQAGTLSLNLFIIVD
jgi:hypothetical protein